MPIGLALWLGVDGPATNVPTLLHLGTLGALRAAALPFAFALTLLLASGFLTVLSHVLPLWVPIHTLVHRLPCAPPHGCAEGKLCL
jgi:hypothetical protein